MSGSIFGRVQHSRAAPIAIPPRVITAATVDPVATCVTETFDTADSSTLGPDQTWLEYDVGTGVDAVVKDDAFTMVASVASAGGHVYARAEADCSSTDMVTSATVTAIEPSPTPAQSLGYGVFARMIDFPGDGGGNAADPVSFQAGNLIGWHFYVTQDDTNWYGNLDFAYYDSVFESFSSISGAASYQSGSFGPGVPLGSPIVPGDVLSLQVTGVGSSTRVVCSVNGTTLLDAAGNTLAQMNFYPGSGDPTDQYAQWSETLNSTGQRGGVSLFSSVGGGNWISGDDYVPRLDDFSACPA